MPVIVTVLSGLFFWFCYWFFYLDGHLKVEAAFLGRRNAKRRAAALDAEARSPIRTTTDPRDAATILMFLVARQKGDYSGAQLQAIEHEMRTVLSLEGDLADRQSYARFAVSKSPSVMSAIIDLAPLFNERLTADERQDLYEMVDRIARVDGPPNEDQTFALTKLTERLAPPAETGEGFGWTKVRA